MLSGSGCWMGDEEAASSGDTEPAKPITAARRIASALSGSLSGTLISTVVQVRPRPISPSSSYSTSNRGLHYPIASMLSSCLLLRCMPSCENLSDNSRKYCSRSMSSGRACKRMPSTANCSPLLPRCGQYCLNLARVGCGEARQPLWFGCQ